MARFMLRVLVVLVSGLLVGCGVQPAPTPTVEPTEAPPRIALVVGVGGLEDDSFNELTYSGVIAFTGRRGLNFDVEEAPAVAEYEATVRQVAENGYDLILTVSFPMAGPTQAVAADFPETYFIGIDQNYETGAENLTGIIFPEDHAGYLAGVLAANMTETNTVGGVFGPEVVLPVARFAEGYEAGVRAVSEDIEILSLFHPGSVDEGFVDPEWGQQTAAEHIAAGADVIFAAAGDTGNGALVETANRALDDERVFCIGVDTDQWQTVPDARPCLLTSAVKDIPQAVEDVMLQVLDGNPPDGVYSGPAGLASFHDFAEVIPEELQAELAQIAADLTSGELEIGGEGA